MGRIAMRTATPLVHTRSSQRFGALARCVVAFGLILMLSPFVAQPSPVFAAAPGDLLSNVPVVDENDLNNAACGVAAATMVLDYYLPQAGAITKALTIQAVHQYVKEYPEPGPYKGSTTDQVKGGLEQASRAPGLEVGEPLTAAWKTTDQAHWFAVLLSELDQKHPVVVYLADGGVLWPHQGWHYGHYIVVSGYTAEQSIIYHDPWDGQAHTLSNAAFGTAWGTAWNKNPAWWYMTVAPASAESDMTPTAAPRTSHTSVPATHTPMPSTVTPTLPTQPTATKTPVPIAKGSVWTSRNSGIDHDLSAVTCPSQTECIAVGQAGTILLSTDGGATWASRSSGTADDLWGLTCPTAGTCLVAGGNIEVSSGKVESSGVILGTTDGGSTWVTRYTDTQTPVSDVSCSSTTQCIAVRSIGSSATDEPSMLASNDGGVSWSDPPVSEGGMGRVVCVTTIRCVVVSDDGMYTLYSGDNGATWAVTDAIVDSHYIWMVGHGLYSVVDSIGVGCAAESTCIAVTESPRVRVSTDRGASWADWDWTNGDPALADFSLSGVSCPSTTGCIAVGDGVIVAFAIGPSSRSTSISRTSRRLSAISCPSVTHCIAVGGGGTILEWQAGVAGGSNETPVVVPDNYTPVPTHAPTATATPIAGVGTWSSSSSGTLKTLRAIACPSSDTCVAVGEAGVVLTSSDTGATWTTANSPLSGSASTSLYSIACPSSNTCLAIGDAGTILVSSAAGWTSVNNPLSGTTTTLQGIACPSSDACLAVDAAGTVLHSSDGGTTWSSISITREDVAGIACPNSNDCLAVGQGDIWSSTDGGDTWSDTRALPPDTTISLNAIACPSSSECVAVGGGGTILTSNNGGSTWISQDTSTGENLYGVACPTTSTCLAVGGSDQILTSEDGGAIWSISSTLNGLYGITCVTTSACLAVGGDGTILRWRG